MQADPAFTNPQKARQAMQLEASWQIVKPDVAPSVDVFCRRVYRNKFNDRRQIWH